jgi:hypothetical protein
VSEQLTPAESRPSRLASRCAPGIVAGLLLGLVVAAAVVVALHRGSSSGSATGSAPVAAAAAGPATARPTASAAAATGGGAAPVVAIRRLLARRAAAIRHHSRAGLLATIDPTRRRFAASQARMLADLHRIPLAGWSYTLSGQGGRAAVPGYRVPTYAPTVFLHYRLRGFDPVATDVAQYPTFTRRGGRWYLASLDDFAAAGRVSATDLWDYGPVDVVRAPRVLVLGPPSMLETMHQVATGMQAAIPRVSSVWGGHWARRVVAEVPATQRELGQITGDSGNLSKLAALSSAEVSSAAGDPAPVGDRVSVNPAIWPSLDALGRQVVLGHELTHIASRADTGRQTPRWLQEGFADYVGFRGSGVAVTVVAAELARDVRAGRLPRRLPANRQFDGSSPRLDQAYEEGWLACRLIAARVGQRALVRFYRQVGTATTPAGSAVDQALHRLLHLSTRRFTALWRGYVQAQLR